MSVLLPAVNSLTAERRTRRYNISHTASVTGILPNYLRIYEEDVDRLDEALHIALHIASSSSPMSETMTWHFIAAKFGQRRLMKQNETFSGLQAFGLKEMFDLSRVCGFSAHLALNFKRAYSFCWSRSKIRRWSSGECTCLMVHVHLKLLHPCMQREGVKVTTRMFTPVWSL